MPGNAVVEHVRGLGNSEFNCKMNISNHFLTFSVFVLFEEMNDSCKQNIIIIIIFYSVFFSSFAVW